MVSCFLWYVQVLLNPRLNCQQQAQLEVNCSCLDTSGYYVLFDFNHFHCISEILPEHFLLESLDNLEMRLMTLDSIHSGF